MIHDNFVVDLLSSARAPVAFYMALDRNPYVNSSSWSIKQNHVKKNIKKFLQIDKIIFFLEFVLMFYKLT